MTSKERIEELVNYFGETLEDLPKPNKESSAYDEADLCAAKARAAEWDLTEYFDSNRETLCDFICHQSDVIEKLVKALETAAAEKLRCKNCNNWLQITTVTGRCKYSDYDTLLDMSCPHAKKKIIRGNRANWIGYGTDQGILWVNPVDKKEEFERYEESNSDT